MEPPQYDANRSPDDGVLRALPLQKNHRPLFVSAVLVASLAIGILAALTPRYETNDDAAMNAIAAGRGFVDRPDEHLLYSNVLIGLGLKALYQLAPSIPWYGGYWFVLGCASLLAICYACLRHDLSEWKVGLTGLFLWVAGIPVLTQLQFTRIALLAGLAGLLLLASAIRVPSAPRAIWFAIPLLLSGGLVRIDALRLVCVVLAPVILWMVWRARQQREARIAMAVLLACVALGYGADRFNKWYYSRDVAWSEFFPVNTRRVEIMDFDRVEQTGQTPAAIQAAGWLPIDMSMLRSWAFLDRDRYNSQSFQTILDAAPSSSGQSTRPWCLLLQQLGGDGELWGLLACGAAGLAILATDRSARFVPVGCFAVTLVTCLFVYRYMHLPARVYCPVFSGCAITAIVFSAGARSFGKRRAWAETTLGRSLALVVLGAVIVWRGGAIWRSNANFLAYRRAAAQMLTELAPQSNQLFVIWAGDFPFEFVILPLQSQALPPGFKVMAMGWTTGFTKSRMDKAGVQDLASLVRRGGQTYFVCQKSEIELLRAYLREHFGLGLKSQVTFAHPVLYDSAIYRLSIEGKAPRS
jgi:hypothetical protein